MCLQKCSHEKTVEFDLISHHKSSENLVAMMGSGGAGVMGSGSFSSGSTPKCLKHSNQSISRSTEANEFPTKSTLKSAFAVTSSSSCPKHNCSSAGSSHMDLHRMCGYSPSLQKRCNLSRCCHQNSSRSIHKSSSSIALTYDHSNSMMSPSVHRRQILKSITKEVYLRDLELAKMRERIAHAEVFLEAMGNACTVKNANSSRFVSILIRETVKDFSKTLVLFQGKFFDIEFDYKGDPTGAHLTMCKYYWPICSLFSSL